MAEEINDNKFISKHNSGFPDYLDFNRLRSEGIDYLGKLSGKVWTDHNVHDPGITILEVLCYALLDLGYRTNLSPLDLLTKAPDQVGPDNNFFTPAQILSCNPLTINDFRKLIIDVDGVKNAWLEVAEDQMDFCKKNNRSPNDFPETHNPSAPTRNICVDFLNGLYHVYLDLENDRQSSEDKKAILANVKAALMAHRNICEDFADISLLCKLELGICAEIELEAAQYNFDPSKVYLDVVGKLREFFSPSPIFYTLPQLLEKGKSIEEIFAGRPFNSTESHGFVDAEELEQLELRKEIHLSDVYQVILNIEGVKAVRKLKLVSCTNNSSPINGWKFKIPENHVPEFSIKCSAFQFLRNTMPLAVDFKKYEGFFEINFNHNGKIAYKSPSPYLDLAIPKGVYRPDLADHYSIQDEFPRVYGISEGDLSKNASRLRQAQALQLKGYLLFFDQLLANYLSQLKNIRSLFSLDSPQNEEDQHTYFINTYNTDSGFQQLLRFSNDSKAGNNLGEKGSVVVYPVDKKDLIKKIESGEITKTKLEDINRFFFSSSNERDIAISQLKDDMLHEMFTGKYITKSDECVFYYILTSSEDFALISKRYFKDEQAAKQALETVKYIGAFEENYNVFRTETDDYSFTIDFNLSAYSKYLQVITEDTSLYCQRRHAFLNHLLARFSERFTDFALLSYGFKENSELAEKEIKAKEKFLKNYPELSSTRGKGYNYLSNGWNSGNISGFEKRFKAITGIQDLKRQSLCNFEVYKYEDTFNIDVEIEGVKLFRSDESYEHDRAVEMLQLLFKTLSSTGKFSIDYDSHEKNHSIQVKLENGHNFATPLNFPSQEEASDAVHHLVSLFSTSPVEEDVFVNKYKHKLELRDYTDNISRLSRKSFIHDRDALDAFDSLIPEINEPKRWEAPLEENPIIGRLIKNPVNEGSEKFIDLDAFKIDIDSNIEEKPEKCSYELLDKKNKFKFLSTKEFDTPEEAEADSRLLIGLLMDSKNYYILENEENKNRFFIHINKNEQPQAISSSFCRSRELAREKADKIIALSIQHQYSLTIEKTPFRWKFKYPLGLNKHENFEFQSSNEFKSFEEALEAAQNFSKRISNLQITRKNNFVRLVHEKGKKQTAVFSTLPKGNKKEEAENTVQSVDKLLKIKNKIFQLNKNPEPKHLRNFIRLDEESRIGNYVYRLVSKDEPFAYMPSRLKINKESKALEKRKCLNDQADIGYSYLEICLGGDIIRKRKDPDSQIVWYHYQVKCRNRFYKSGSLAGKEVLLFESVTAYDNPENAQKAFKENYLIILKKAINSQDYGENRYISTTEIYRSSYNSCNEIGSMVYIPKETLDELGGNEEAALKELVKIVKSYPVRYIKKGVYKFNLYNQENDWADWRSYAWYSTPQEAMQAFFFFYMLLKYKGNYLIHYDEDHCSYRILIREVLAESAERFFLAKDAWAKEGVQKFIHVAQTSGSFHTSLRKEGCCYSFFVACKNPFAVHPCKYNSSKKRDRIMESLDLLFKNLVKEGFFKRYTENISDILTDFRGNTVANIFLDQKKNQSLCQRWIELTENIFNDTFYKGDEEKGFYLIDHQEVKIAEPVNKYIELNEWKEKLSEIAYYFPIVKMKDKDEREKYCIEIKFPTLNDWREDLKEEIPCPNEKQEVAQQALCYVAWKSECCYASCEEAMQRLKEILILLSDYNNYIPVFGCDCGSYGISLLEKSDIVAYNPQCYGSPEMACEAVERAKNLINGEGLHLVEHILLRPHCESDCECRGELCYHELSNCDFPAWKRSDDLDPCHTQKDICFIPGADPYSFIATVALPAWPERYRKEENRQLIENLLQREVPAHILLRILWLAPHDLCCFETFFKKWNRWLAQNKSCKDNFNSCDFIQFLFHRKFECLDNTRICHTCEEEEENLQIPCFKDDDGSNKLNFINFLEQVNTLFCWEQSDCDAYEFLECEKS